MLTVKSHTVTTDYDEIPNAFSIALVSTSPRSDKDVHSECKTGHHQVRDLLPNQDSTDPTDTFNMAVEAVDYTDVVKEEVDLPHTTTEQQYDLFHIVGHWHQHCDTQYCIDGYGYPKRDDTFESNANNPDLFLSRYWPRRDRR